MEDSEKSASSLGQNGTSGTHEFAPNEILVLQQILAGTDPMIPLMTTDCIDPVNLRFAPEGAWSSAPVSLHNLHEDYFARKNNVNRRFEHKLWNALQITSAFPAMVKLVGVMWVTDTIIKVYKHSFARLLNISAVDGGLFHKQGNFTRHGFVMLSDIEARHKVMPDHLQDVDFRDVLLVTHPDNRFTMLADEGSVSSCRWKGPNSTSRIASLRTSLET